MSKHSNENDLVLVVCGIITDILALANLAKSQICLPTVCFKTWYSKHNCVKKRAFFALIYHFYEHNRSQLRCCSSVDGAKASLIIEIDWSVFGCQIDTRVNF